MQHTQLPVETLSDEEFGWKEWISISVTLGEPQVQIGSHSFTFDYVYGSIGTPSSRIFEDCVEPLVDVLFLAYNATVLACGQIRCICYGLEAYCVYCLFISIDRIRLPSVGTGALSAREAEGITNISAGEMAIERRCEELVTQPHSCSRRGTELEGKTLKVLSLDSKTSSPLRFPNCSACVSIVFPSLSYNVVRGYGEITAR
ncbi:hypothetical protein L1987_02153 [Smallanthus sonchifolius]|uniref:Uncharacterized protein n=1 Tax=Smallanthus sonchifolius TaxID=185202 RepID=A0ACB9K750_9ASTR|nr:hypothetical protein L1987_02153 [Smallanthus sonchifolius]